MTGQSVRIGVIDSGVHDPLAGRVDRWRSFTGDSRLADTIGHGSRICELICEQSGDADLVVAKVFGNRPTTQPAIIAEAIDWLVAEQVALINMSFGLAADRPVLAEASARAGQAGIILVASAPAQGIPAYPAAYPDAIAVTGDARCGRGEISHLGAIAEFGTWCASPEQDPDTAISGASIAAAHFTGLAASWLVNHPGATRQEVVTHFLGEARFHGPERRAGAGPRPA